jgi:PAS domain S-box-containing protein
MLGYGPEDVLGQEMHALIHHHRRNSLPYPSEECQIYQVLKSRQGCHVDDEVLWRQDGTAFPSYYSAYPIEEQGTMKGVVVAFTNITERKRAELALRDSEERHQMIAQATNDGLWDWNVTTNTMWWSENLLTLFGYQPGAIKPSYEAWGALLHPDDRVRVMDRIRAVLENGQNVFADEYRCHRTDGTYAYVFDRAYILRDQAGVPLRMIGAMMDMTERKRMELALGESERQLRQALDEREQLSLDLHDNIIQSIYAVGLCLEECQHLLQQDVKRVDKRLNLAITDLNYVIRDVRNYIAGDTSGVITPTQLREELSRLTQITKGADLLRFRLRLDPLAVKLLTPDEARHILFIAQEAMSNSLRHAHAKHGYVSILMKDGCLRLEVKDDGLGFQASDIPEGQGLRNIAARALKLQARIQVISEAGFGTLIILDIPKENRHGPHNQ